MNVTVTYCERVWAEHGNGEDVHLFNLNERNNLDDCDIEALFPCLMNLLLLGANSLTQRQRHAVEHILYRLEHPLHLPHQSLSTWFHSFPFAYSSFLAHRFNRNRCNLFSWNATWIGNAIISIPLPSGHVLWLTGWLGNGTVRSHKNPFRHFLIWDNVCERTTKNT